MKAIKMHLMVLLILSAPGMAGAQHVFNSVYKGSNVSRISFPIGGIGTGMFTLDGTGSLSHVSVRHHPDMFNEPVMFAALYIKGIGSRVIEGQVPDWKKFGQHDNARGAEGKDYGLARFGKSTFIARFPFGIVNVSDTKIPIQVRITGWSPFIPTEADNSSLPVGALEYTLVNRSSTVQTGVFSFSAENFMANDEHAPNTIRATPGGFILAQDATLGHPENEGCFAIFTGERHVTVDYCWFRGGWWDPLTMAWKKISAGDTKSVDSVKEKAPGASLFIPFHLKPKESRTIKILMCWYVPHSRLRLGVASTKTSDTTAAPSDGLQPSRYFMPWYASKFKNIGEVITYWKKDYDRLKHDTRLFKNAFYKSSLPPEVLEAVAANLTILKSPTVMRQYDGRFWGWEGSNDETGSCAGNCTHVYNYAQSLCHLFPALERTIRETEFTEGLDQFGHQNYRQALPIRPEGHDYYLAAADGQLGSIMRAYREWRISGDDSWLRKLYPAIKLSLDYCIKTFDPGHTGMLMEPHHNTYDIEFWGADPMCTGIYLGALEAFVAMTDYLENHKVSSFTGSLCSETEAMLYKNLLAAGKKSIESSLYNGRYFMQRVQWKGLHGKPDTNSDDYHSPEAKKLLLTEGPKYQYGLGVLSDGVIGAWLAEVCGLSCPLDRNKIKHHLNAVYQYNYKTDLSSFSNPQRSTYALGNEGGLLLCTWPLRDQPSLPFVYSNEVWTGVEYEVASHLIFLGKIKEGLSLVQTTRKRYEGTIRNPFDEYECGHWYARAMSSYALLQALTGVRYDAVTKTLFVNSRVGDFTIFLSTDTGFGSISYKKGKVSLNVVYGRIDVRKTTIIE